MKQTAVEWLVERLSHYYPNIEKSYNPLFKKAKEMEKEQQGYSEEEVLKAQQAILCNIKDALMNENYIIEYIEQFKNK